MGKKNWDDQSATDQPKPCIQDVIDEATNIVTQYQHPADAGRWIIAKLLEPERPEERSRMTAMTGSSGNRWDYPYRSRVIPCVQKYCTLTPDDRKFIKAAREDGVFWRGDDMDFFHTVYDETMKMREVGIETYRKKALESMKKVFASMG